MFEYRVHFMGPSTGQQEQALRAAGFVVDYARLINRGAGADVYVTEVVGTAASEAAAIAVVQGIVGRERYSHFRATLLRPAD